MLGATRSRRGSRSSSRGSIIIGVNSQYGKEGSVGVTHNTASGLPEDRQQQQHHGCETMHACLGLLAGPPA